MPTLISKKLVPVPTIGTHLSEIGSVPLGYVCSVALPSRSHLNTSESSNSLTLSPTCQPWLLSKVSLSTPVLGLYVARFGV